LKATLNQNFILMASSLLIEYAWLLGVILISLLLRVSGRQIRSAFHIYAPLLFVGFMVIAFRIILIPRELVNLIFPPLLLLCTLWQWRMMRKHHQNIPQSDMFYTYISQAIFILSLICSWLGYTLMADFYEGDWHRIEITTGDDGATYLSIFDDPELGGRYRKQ
jgi:hypothetical protein